jgi:hypothetical protein
LRPASAPGVGIGLGLTGVFVAGAALGLTGLPSLAAVSPPVAGAALGLAARACASLLQTSKSAWTGPAALAMLAKASRLTPEMTSISPVNLRMIRLAFFLRARPPCQRADEGRFLRLCLVAGITAAGEVVPLVALGLACHLTVQCRRGAGFGGRVLRAPCKNCQYEECRYYVSHSRSPSQVSLQSGCHRLVFLIVAVIRRPPNSWPALSRLPLSR